MNRQTVLSTSTGLLLDLVPPTPGPNTGWRFYEISRRLLADVVASSYMTCVQACVLHGGYLCGWQSIWECTNRSAPTYRILSS
ncbi:unnamed protein product, partial [Clonostachys chloroleuca]